MAEIGEMQVAIRADVRPFMRAMRQAGWAFEDFAFSMRLAMATHWPARLAIHTHWAWRRMLRLRWTLTDRTA